MRNELFHPLISHFPIAFLTLYPFAIGVSLFLKDDFAEKAKFVARVFLYLGLLMHFVSLFLGELALEIVAPKICSLPLAYDHENWAQIVLVIYILIVLLDLLHFVEKFKNRGWHQVAKLIVALAALFPLVKLGHTGAELVYDYGTAVENSSCQK